jgi:hypothetical protein
MNAKLRMWMGVISYHCAVTDFICSAAMSGICNRLDTLHNRILLCLISLVSPNIKYLSKNSRGVRYGLVQGLVGGVVRQQVVHLIFIAMPSIISPYKLN